MKRTIVCSALLLIGLFLPASAQELKKLDTGPLTNLQRSLLEQLKTVPPPQWMMTARKLADKPSASVLTELEKLANDDQEETRKRACYTLIKMKTKESLERAVKTALSDKSPSLRITVSSYLSSEDTPDLLNKANLMVESKKGLSDRKQEVRFAFALILAKAGDKAAVPTLKKMLSNRDHHHRQSAAESLAELGDDSGVKILIKMLSYTDKNHPFLKANKSMKKDASAWDSLLRIVREERLRICGLLGRLKAEKALPVLRKLAGSKDPEISKAARKSIEDIESTEDSGEE